MGNPLAMFKPVPCPDSGEAKGVRVFRVKPNKREQVVFVSDGITGVLTHFDGRREGLCPRVIGGVCERCDQVEDGRWSGWALGIVVGYKHLRLIHLTEGAVRNCPALKARQNCELRGWTVGLSRMNAQANGPVEVTWLDKKTPVMSWEDPPNILPILVKLYGKRSFEIA